MTAPTMPAPQLIFRIPDRIAADLESIALSTVRYLDGTIRVTLDDQTAPFYMKRTHPRLVNQWSTWEA